MCFGKVLKCDIIVSMDISYLGKNGYKIKAKAGSVVFNGTNLVISHKSGGDDFVVEYPGEYEVEGISVFGYGSKEEMYFIVQNEDIRIAVLGHLANPISEKNLAEMENIDVVIMGVDAMAMKDLTEVVSKLEPYFVLPYGEQVQKFVASYEHGSKTVKNLPLSKLSMPEDVTEVIVFE